ncbi:alpha/beta fold hydrolase [Candidatus Uabimicrobium amorphum]|uniref:Hydrolase n=1 Tax=Uabimicrobium amorphum TaxID=2596890 RepID=A0A5S9INW0_UABAM|nr:alpha/beta hydrolase [Candidatus Uabimicrobium amorphum]BBM85184.1 hydrolase [Candidatus Uabimicrobium amorphum]
MNIEEWKDRGKFYTHNNQRIFYVDEGQGEVVLCIHGFPTCSWDWHLIWESLCDNFRVIAIDMVGFGYSDKPQNYNYSIMDQADLHENVLSSLGVGAAHILSHDYGDTVAQELLARKALRKFTIKSMCLLNGGLFPETHHPRLIQTLLASRCGVIIKEFLNFRSFARSFCRIFGKNTQPTHRELKIFWELISHNKGHKVAHKLIRYMEERKKFRDRWVGALISADVPLQLINGVDDPVSGRHMAERYKELVTKENVVLLENIGHYPQVESAPEVFAEFLSFIKSQK